MLKTITIKENNLKYHNSLADYFKSKSLPYAPLHWDNCSNRILTELTFQILHSSDYEHVENLLCNPLFLEASIKGGLLYNVVDDLNVSIEKLKLMNVVPIRESILNGIAAMRSRPSLLIYIIINRLINADISKITKDFINVVLKKLDTKGEWLCTQTPFPKIQYIKGIININTIKKKYYVKTSSEYIDVYDLEMHKKIHQIGIISNEPEISIHPVTEKIACLSSEGKLSVDSTYIGLYLKSGTSIFNWLGSGLIGINNTGFLCYINLEEKTETKIWNNTILPFSKISVSLCTKSAIVISGDRPPNQHILFIRMKEEKPECIEWQVDIPIVYRVCLDQKGEFALFSTWSRELLLINIASMEARKISTRIASGISIREKIKDFILFSSLQQQIAVLTTETGELLTWDTSLDTLKRRGSYKGLLQEISVQSIGLIPKEDKMYLATNLFLETTSLNNEVMLSPKSAVNQCCLTGDKYFVILNENEKKVSWYKDGRFLNDFYYQNFSPCSLSPFGKDGAVAIGYKNGVIAIAQPDKFINAYNVFSDGSPIISVIPFNQSRILAVNKNGQISLSNLINMDDYKVIKGINSIQEVLFVSQLGIGNDIIICGKNNVGNVLLTAVIIRQNDARELIFETREKVYNIVSNEDGTKIFALSKYRIDCYEYDSSKWKLTIELQKEVLKMSSCFNNRLAFILKLKGLNWLELWSMEKNMKYLCAMELPVETSSICSYSNLVGIGTEDGNTLMIEVRDNHSN